MTSEEIADSILKGKYYLKFVKREKYRDAIMRGELLVRPLKYFLFSKETGIGDQNTCLIERKGYLGIRSDPNAEFDSIIPIHNFRSGTNYPAFCVFNFSGIPHQGNGVFNIPNEMIKNFGEYCVFLEQNELLQKMENLLGANRLMIRQVEYNNNEFSKQERRDIMIGKSLKHLFSTSTANWYMQETRCVFLMDYDDFVKQRFISKAEGIDIQDGCIVNVGEFTDVISKVHFGIFKGEKNNE